MSRKLAQARDWVFDLDNTLYPAAATLLSAVEARMTEFIMRELALDGAAAAALRERYFLSHGATVAGLAERHAISGRAFLEYVHEVAMDALAPDMELNALIAALPGRKIVFTNGGGGYPERVLARLGLSRVIDAVWDIESTGFIAKPGRAAYEGLLARFALDPRRCILVEDTLRNLAPAHALGFVTALVGNIHPEPRPDYVDYWARDLKALLREVL